MTPEEILSRYSEVISSEVTNYQGEIVTTNEKGEPVVAENVNIEKNYKKTPENRLFPVFKYNGGSEQAFILPTFGAGLWDAIWGYVAITPNMETVIGVSFDHKGETPGLGARITSDDVQARYRGKELYDNQGDLVSVTMVKGENTPESALGPNKVDGMAGATLTANGVNAMLENYLGYYQNYFEKNVRNESMTMNVENNNQ